MIKGKHFKGKLIIIVTHQLKSHYLKYTDNAKLRIYAVLCRIVAGLFMEKLKPMSAKFWSIRNFSIETVVNIKTRVCFNLATRAVRSRSVWVLISTHIEKHKSTSVNVI